MIDEQDALALFLATILAVPTFGISYLVTLVWIVARNRD